MCDVHCNSENPLPFGEGVCSMCNTMPTGRYSGIAFNSGRTDVDRYWPGHQACPLQMMCGVQTRSATDVARELDIRWVVHRIVWDQLDYREVCAHWVPKNPTDDDGAHWMGLSSMHLTCYTDQREQFWSWNMVNYTKTETRKRISDRRIIISLQQRKWKHCHQ